MASPPTADLAAQAFRAELGLAAWDERWFAGHHLPGYSLLSPPLMGLLGVGLVGAAAVVALALAGGALAGGGAAAAWLAVAAAAQLASGRVTFLLGAALGAGALLAAERGPRAAAAALGALSAIGSPVAGAFVVLVALGRARWVLAAATALPAGAVLALFPEGGTEPFAASAFWPALAMTAAVGALVPGLRVVCALYVLALAAAFVVPTPMGGNATRLGMLAAGPALLAGASRRGPLVAVLLAGAAWWVAYPAVRDVRRGADDPARAAAFHLPLLAELERRGTTGHRLEVPMTANHFEARRLAPHVPLARGWVRQLDRGRNGLFYDGRLDGARLRRWLDARAVRWVAVPVGVPLDGAGREEARLVLAGAVPGVREAWRGPGWRLYEVAGAPPIARGAGRVVAVRDHDLLLRADRAGAIEVRGHWSRWRAVTRGPACAAPWPGDPSRTLVRASRAGELVLGTRRAGGRCP